MAEPLAPLTRVDSAVQGLAESPTEKVPIGKPITRVDSGVHGLSESPPKEKISHRRASSSSANVQSMKDLRDNEIELEVAIESQATGWKINASPTTVEDKDILKKPLITPLVKSVDLLFDTGVVVTARNMKHGVTIKDALDAIYKHNKKRADDELPKPYLKGFEWLPNHPQLKDDPEKKEERREEWGRLHIHLSNTPGVSSSGGGKKKKSKNAE
ncbi:hypothetical protein F4811DRAFT_465130 [Daldinia bambusicola]|nr:hypothetical protein F4811DRAFT_465130 [Daldinia bambusicola]